MVSSKEMKTGPENNKNQQGALAMSVVEKLVYGAASGTSTSGRTLVAIQMQIHEHGPQSFKVERLSDTLEIECRGAYSPVIGPDWWWRVQMVFLRNKKGEAGVDKIYRDKPFLWVDMELVRHGCQLCIPPGSVWRDINEKLLNYILFRARDLDNHQGVRADFPSLAGGAMQQKREEIETEGILRRPLLNFNAAAEAKEDADQWYLGFMLGNVDAEDNEDGGAQRKGQDAVNHSPLVGLVDLIQAVVKRDQTEKDKAEGFDLAMEYKKRQNAEEQLQMQGRRWDRIRGVKRKKSVGGKAPRKSLLTKFMAKCTKKLRADSLVDLVECAVTDSAPALEDAMIVENTAQASTVNEQTGVQPMEGLVAEQEPNEREQSEGASSA